MREHNLNSHNQRTFELSGSGAIQIAPYTRDHEFLFENDTDIYLFKTKDELKYKFDYLSKLNENIINEKRLIIKQNCKRKKYSYYDRADFVLSIFNNI